MLEAEDLPWIDLFSPANGYVRAFVGGGRAARTRVVPNSSNPVWNQDLPLLVHAPAHTLEAVVMDFDRLDRDDEVGRCSVDLSTLTPGEPADLWLDLDRPAAAFNRGFQEEWAPAAHGLDRAVKTARLGGAALRQGCGVVPLIRRACGHRGRVHRVHDPSYVGRLHLRVTVHPFSDAERASFAKAAAHGGRGRPAAAADPADSLATDLLNGGLLVVRPLKAVRLPHSKLASAFGVHPAWTVRVAVAGQTGEGGPVKKGDPASPSFHEPVELVVGARALALARGGCAYASVVDARRRPRAVAGTAAIRLDDILAARHVRGDFPLLAAPACGGPGGPPTLAEGAAGGPVLSLDVVWVSLVGGGGDPGGTG